MIIFYLNTFRSHTTDGIKKINVLTQNETNFGDNISENILTEINNIIY